MARTVPPTELAVVGEHKEDPEQLLVQDVQGNYYAYTLPNGDAALVEPDDHWQVEDQPADELLL